MPLCQGWSGVVKRQLCEMRTLGSVEVGGRGVENALGRGRARCHASKEIAGLAGSRASVAGTFGGGRDLITPNLVLVKPISALKGISVS